MPTSHCSRNWWGDARGELEQAPCRLPADRPERGRGGARRAQLGVGAHRARTPGGPGDPSARGRLPGRDPRRNACLAGADSRHRQGAPAGGAAVGSPGGSDDRQPFRGRTDLAGAGPEGSRPTRSKASPCPCVCHHDCEVHPRGVSPGAGIGAAGRRRRRGLRRGVDGPGRSGGGHGAQQFRRGLCAGMAGSGPDAVSTSRRGGGGVPGRG